MIEVWPWVNVADALTVRYLCLDRNRHERGCRLVGDNEGRGLEESRPEADDDR